MFGRTEAQRDARENLAQARTNLQDYSRGLRDEDETFAYLNGEVVRAEQQVKAARRSR